MRRRRRRGAAPCHAFTLTGQQCPHRPAKFPACAMPPGGRNRPPYNARQTAVEMKNTSLRQDLFSWHPSPVLAPVPGKLQGGRSRPPRDLPAAAAFPGRCLASSRKVAGHRNAWGHIPFFRCLPFIARLSGGRNRPPCKARQTAGETGNFAFAADVSFPGTHLRGIVGRAFTPAVRASGRRPASEREAHGPSKLRTPHS